MKQVFLFSRNDKIGEAVKVSPSFLAIASKMLNLPVRDLRVFMKRVKQLDKDRLIKLVSEETTLHSFSNCVIFESGKIVASGAELDWKIICLMYVLANSSDLAVSYRDVMVYIENRSLSMTLLQDELTRHREALKTLHKQVDASYTFFSAELLSKACKKAGMSAKTEGDLCIVSSKQPLRLGAMEYEKITLYISNWQIKSFMIEFNEFDYYSDDHRSIRLHPNLFCSALPYGDKAELGYCIGYYEQYAETLSKLFMIDNPNAGGALVPIKNTFDGLLRLWNDLHYSVKDRRELSQRILKYYLK